jgi:hypothetical protein
MLRCHACNSRNTQSGDGLGPGWRLHPGYSPTQGALCGSNRTFLMLVTQRHGVPEPAPGLMLCTFTY